MWRSTFNKMFPFQPIFFAEEDKGGSGDEGKAGAEVQQQLTKVTEELSKLKGEVDSLKVTKEDLERKLDEADKELLSDEYLDFKSGKRGAPAKGTLTSEEEVDLDRASNSEIVAHATTKAKSDLDKAIKDVTSRIESTEERMGKAFAQIDVALTAIRHSDFDSNKDEIYKVAKDNPTWGAEKCYNQWKLQSKAAADEKKAVEVKKAEEERKALAERGEGVPSSATKGKQLSKDDAASVAFDKAFGAEK
jgi:chromosome segregation ATPase